MFSNVNNYSKKKHNGTQFQRTMKDWTLLKRLICYYGHVFFSKQVSECCVLLTVWWHNDIEIFPFHRRICTFSLCVNPERISPLILADWNATFYCLSAIKEEEKRPRGEDKEDFDGFCNCTSSLFCQECWQLINVFIYIFMQEVFNNVPTINNISLHWLYGKVDEGVSK